MAARLAPSFSDSRLHAGERRQYRVLYAVGVAVFVVAVVFERLVSGVTGRTAQGSGSIFEDARAAADNSIPFAFMGW